MAAGRSHHVLEGLLTQHRQQKERGVAVWICPVTERPVVSRGTARCALSHEAWLSKRSETGSLC